MDPRIQIRIRIHFKISWVRNTADNTVLTLGAERLWRRAGAGDGTPVGPPAGLERLPSLQVDEAGEGGGGMLAASSSLPRCFSRGNSGIFGFFGGWIILNLEEERHW
jgi:hypothetical protein